MLVNQSEQLFLTATVRTYLISPVKFNPLEPSNGNIYIYTTEIEEKNIFLFCNTDDNLIQLYNLYWRREDRVGFYPNPLDLQELANVLKYTNDHDMECFDIESGNEILTVKLYIQGLLYMQRIHTFSEYSLENTQYVFVQLHVHV